MNQHLNDYSAQESEEIINMFISNSIKLDKKGNYYYEKNGRRKIVDKRVVAEVYDMIPGFIEELEGFVKEGDKLLTEKPEETLEDHLLLIQALRSNLLKKDYGKEVSKYLKKLQELVKEVGYEEILQKLLKERYFYPEMMVDLYEAGLIDEIQSCVKIRILNNKGCVTDEELLKAITRPSVTKEMACEMMGEEKLIKHYQKNKSIKYLNYMTPISLLNSYINEQITPKDLERSYLKKSDVLPLIGKQLSGNMLEILVRTDMPDKFIPNTEELMQLLEEEKISKESWNRFIGIDRVEKVIAKKRPKEGTFTSRELFQLVEQELIEDEILLDLYQKQQAMQSAVLFPEAYENELISDEEFRSCITVEKILQKREEGILKDDFLDFYRQILPKDEKELQKFEAETVTMLEEKENSLENLLFFFHQGILGVECIKGHIDEEEVIGKAESLGTEEIWKLYNLQVLSIEALSMIFEGKPEEIARGCKEGKLDASALELMTREELGQYYEEGELSSHNMLQAYGQNLLEVEDLKGKKIKRGEVSQAIDLSFTEEQITELFLNRLLNYDGLVNLVKREVISQEQLVRINQQFDFETAIAEIKQRQIQNEAIAEGEQRARGRYTRFDSEGENQRRLPNIGVKSRLDYFESLDTENPEPIYRSDKLGQGERAALEGYDYIICKKLGVIILEKFYEDNTTDREIEAVDNATYILPPVKLIEYLEKSNKQDLREDTNVRYVNHTANWGRNLLKASAEVNPGLDKKSLLKEYKEFNQLLREEYEMNVR